MVLFILVTAYILASFVFFDIFREHISHAGFFHVLFISLIWPLSIPYGYVKAVVRNYKELTNHDK